MTKTPISNALSLQGQRDNVLSNIQLIANAAKDFTAQTNHSMKSCLLLDSKQEDTQQLLKFLFAGAVASLQLRISLFVCKFPVQFLLSCTAHLLIQTVCCSRILGRAISIQSANCFVIFPRLLLFTLLGWFWKFDAVEVLLVKPSIFSSAVLPICLLKT